MKKFLKKSIVCFFVMFMVSATVSSFSQPMQVEASAKSDKAVKQAKKCYYTTQKNLRRYKRINNGSGCIDYWNGNHLALSVIKPAKGNFLAISGTVCEYYYSGRSLSFAFAYQKSGRKVKEYRAYYMGGKCYRYIGPDKKVHTYGSGKKQNSMPKMAKQLYFKGTYNLHFVY